jgi:hypothetical protein
MSEAFECYVCRKVMVLFGADPNRCPGCGSVHGKAVAKRHIDRAAKARTGRARLQKQAKRSSRSRRRPA